VISKLLKILIVITLLSNTSLLIADSVFVENKKLFAIGLQANGLYNQYNANFSNFQGTFDCGKFNNGYGLGYSFAIYIEKEIYNNVIIGFDACYVNRSGIFSVVSNLPIRDIDFTDLNQIKIDNNLEINLKYLDLMPYIKYNIINKNEFLNLNIGLGFGIGLPVIAEFEQKEEIVSPDYVNFISTGTKERKIANDKIKSINSLHYGLQLKLENLIELSNQLHLTQQLSFNYGLNNITNDVDWKISSFAVGLGIRYSIEENIYHNIPVELQDTIITVEPDTIIPPEEILSVKILDEKSDFLVKKGSELRATLPIINTIFFETNSSEIQNFYILRDTVLPSFYYGDPIVARRFVFLRIKDIIKKNPTAQILLNGATSGNEQEPGGLELARKRTEAVKKIFLSLGIPENQIISSESVFPKTASNQDYPEGKMENQRVDVFIKNAQLQEYVGIQNFSEFVGHAVVSVGLENVIDKKHIYLSSNLNDSVYNITNAGEYSIPFIIKNVGDSVSMMVKVNHYDKFAKDSLNLILKELRQNPIDVNYNNFKTILTFDFASAELRNENKELLSQLVSQLPNNLTIIIKGSADALGTEAKNLQLSDQRASAVKDYINKISGNKLNVIIEKGFDKFIEITPEGRFLNRAISIEIKNP
jgi:outer membrane protein OmpA-like peptidoglycan-associated protein/opacity protein-like surface antigen